MKQSFLSKMSIMKGIFFLCLWVVYLTGLFSTEKSESYRKETIWKGEVTAVYKNKNRIRVTIYGLKNSSELQTKKQIKDYLQTAQSLELKEKDTHNSVAKFILKDMYLESLRTKGKKHDVDLVLIGSFIAPDGLRYKKINTNLYIEAANFYDQYLDSSAFFHSNSNIPQTIYHPTDNKEMVFVPGGLFLYGQGISPFKDNYNPNFKNLNANNLLEIQSFYIDKYEVTNSEYLRYLKETNNPPPEHWLNGTYPAGKADHPIIRLSYREVELYANWSGKRIPTEFEWEKAARGNGFTAQLQKDESKIFTASTVLYPFGNKYDKTLCNCSEFGTLDTVSVYELSPKGASVYGIIGMCGNAPEWTSSWYDEYKGQNIKNSYYGKIYKVIRGGSYIDSYKECRSDFRMYGGIPNLREDRKAGFRLLTDYTSR